MKVYELIHQLAHCNPLFEVEFHVITSPPGPNHKPTGFVASMGQEFDIESTEYQTALIHFSGKHYRTRQRKTKARRKKKRITTKAKPK